MTEHDAGPRGGTAPSDVYEMHIFDELYDWNRWIGYALDEFLGRWQAMPHHIFISTATRALLEENDLGDYLEFGRPERDTVGHLVAIELRGHRLPFAIDGGLALKSFALAVNLERGASDESHLGCCDRPALDTVKTLYEKSHDTEELRRCTRCGASWFWRFHEHVNFDDDDSDEQTVWFTRLTEEEGRRLGSGAERPDLEFLREREAIQIDNRGVRRVRGQPTGPWS
ncbi:MAG: hypothetical protein HYS27_04485 [Deltaproteobacteria bacterium]|nr:hypothetical protein [Deltaproteobacteria bacterium]